jgi:streptomycin 6-kinase
VAVAAIVIPGNLAAQARRDADGGLRDWVAGLPGVVADLAARWSLRVGEPYQPGGQCSWVAPVRTASGGELVLKAGWRHLESEHEADGLRAWDGRGTVRLHAEHRSAATIALLLEPCVPGTPLGRVLPGPGQDVIVAGLLRRLWITPAGGQPFRPLQAMCDQWAARAEARLTGPPGAVDPGLARDGLELMRTLPATADRSVLLCTDLHAGNILAARREPWLVIDPKPYLGDPAYDAIQHMLNCGDRLAADPAGLARQMAELLGLDPERVTRWLFARCAVESADSPFAARVAARIAAR